MEAIVRCLSSARTLCLQAWTDFPCLCCRVVEAIKGCRQQLLAICQDIVFEDPMAELCQQLQALSDPVLAASSLEAVAGNDMLSNTLVMFLRFLTSSELQAREDFFAPFVMVGRLASHGPDTPHTAGQRHQLADPMRSACQAHACSCNCAGRCCTDRSGSGWCSFAFVVSQLLSFMMGCFACAKRCRLGKTCV